MRSRNSGISLSCRKSRSDVSDGRTFFPFFRVPGGFHLWQPQNSVASLVPIRYTSSIVVACTQLSSVARKTMYTHASVRAYSFCTLGAEATFSHEIFDYIKSIDLLGSDNPQLLAVGVFQ